MKTRAAIAICVIAALYAFAGAIAAIAKLAEAYFS